MPFPGTAWHSCILATSALIAAALGLVAAKAAAEPPVGGGSSPSRPCAGQHAPTLKAMHLDHDPNAVPRDGLFVAFERGTVEGALAPVTGISFMVDAGIWDPLRLRLESESGEVIAGTQRSRVREGLAFRPAQPLDPGRRYRLHTRIDYNSNCFIGPVIEQTHEFVTETGLRESVPPALESLAYGNVWRRGPTTYCCHTELSHCPGQQSCLACMDHFRQPMLFPGAKADPAQEESLSLITELAITDADGTVYVNTPDNWRKHALGPVQLEGDLLFHWGPNPTRICLRASTETLRTGALTYAERCLDIDPGAVADGSSLDGVSLPPDFLRAAPVATTHARASSLCVNPTSAMSDVDYVYAARFVPSLPAAASFLYEAERGWSADAGARERVDAGHSGSTHGAAAPLTNEDEAGCTLGSSRARGGASVWLLCSMGALLARWRAATWPRLRLRRTTRRPRPRRE